MRIPGVCNQDPATTVAAHSGRGQHGAGMGVKADDVFVAFLCSDCHDAYDNRKGSGVFNWTRNDLDVWWDCAHASTLRRLFELGVLKVG